MTHPARAPQQAAAFYAALFIIPSALTLFYTGGQTQLSREELLASPAGQAWVRAARAVLPAAPAAAPTPRARAICRYVSVGRRAWGITTSRRSGWRR